jgi:glycosyltransferase involved in cell wall biosynthesis
MRIAYLSSALTVHDERFLRKLVERGYETSLITYYPSALPLSIAGISGLTIVHPRPRRLLRLQSGLFGFKGASLRRILQALKPDVLHSGYVWKDGFAAARAGFHPHLVMPWGSDILVEPVRSRVLKWIVRYVLRRADMITCDCQVVADRIVALSGFPRDRIVVFPWGVDRAVFHPDVVPATVRRDRGWVDKTVIIMNRNFEPIYNVAGFLFALELILRQRSDVRVLLGGSGSEEGRLRELVRNRGLEDVVLFLGKISPARMAEYLVASDLYVSNSFSDGSSLSLLEAMSCGLPVVVTDVAANLEWVTPGENGFVVRRGDSAGLAATLLVALSDPDRLREMSARNLETALARANWDRNFAKLEDVYRRLKAANLLSDGRRT